MIKLVAIGCVKCSLDFHSGEILKWIGGDINVEDCEHYLVRSILIWTSLGVSFGAPVFWEGMNRKNKRKLEEIVEIGNGLSFQFG